MDERRRENRSEEPTRKEYEHVLPDDFKIPDMSPLGEGEFGRDEMVEFPIEVGDLKLRGELTFERYRDEKRSQLARVDLEGFDPETKKRVIVFKAVLSNFDPISRYYPKGKGVFRDWFIHFRKVDQKFRKKGLGKWSMLALEEAMRRVSEENEALKADWIQLSTQLGSLSNLLIDPNWLEGWIKEHGTEHLWRGDILEERAENKDLNLGYEPHPRDVNAAIKILQLSSEEQKDSSSMDPDVILVKKINPDIEFKNPGEW